MCAVLKNLFFNSKLDLFLVQIFMKIGLTELKVITISLDMGKSKWQISEKKALKLPKYQNRISQELFRVWWKKFCSLLFLIRRNIWAKFDQNLRGWVTKLKILSLFDVELPCYKSWWYVIYPTFYYKLGQNLVETKAENLLNSRNSSIF